MYSCKENLVVNFNVSQWSGTYGSQRAATKLREFGIETQAMRGQGYDGAANMADKFSSVRTRIQTEIPEAYYVHTSVVSSAK
jgi:hypothetical protein